MKKSRLLEIIREEIAGALNEAGLGDQISAMQKQKDAIEKQKAPLIKKEADISKKIADLEKKQADAEVKSSSTLEEDTLNEMARITEPIRKGIEVAVDRLVKQKSDITPDEITRLIRNKKSQEKVAPELAAALEADADEKGGDAKYTFGIGYPQTLGAVQIAMGLKKAKGSEPKAEKPAKEKAPKEKAPKEKTTTASKSEPMDGEDKEATQNVGSDSTAKELGKKADVSKNPDFDRIRKGLQNKRKNSKDGILSPEDMKLAINIINTAKDKYKFNTTQVDSLRADIGL
jgi:hypothetical protein